nr:IS5/IS1182 family transposase [Candidatus Latescibacterota bacterium]
MSLKPQSIEPIPDETCRIAQAAFPKGNPYMTMRDELGVFFDDAQFAALFSPRGQSALSPWRLGLITVMQYAENLTDRQAADAVRSRLDWKYALGLALTDPGFDFSVLSEFRTRLIVGSAEHILLETMLTCFQERALLKAGGKQRTDATHVLAAIRTLTRLELIAETMTHTLNILATVSPDWLQGWVPAVWHERYDKRIDEYRLPQAEKKRLALAQQIGLDGHQVLTAIARPDAPDCLRLLPAIETMRRIWLQHFYIDAESRLTWRQSGNLPPPARMISSPHDPEARYATKRHTTRWVGYKVHLTETCDEEQPHLITSVQTTVATETDNRIVKSLYKELDRTQRLPREHLIDMGYASTDLLLHSRKEYGIEQVCPMRPDNTWQANTEGAFDISAFTIDWGQQVVTCPQGKQSVYWKSSSRDNLPKFLVKFDSADCHVCPQKTHCTRSRCKALELLDTNLAVIQPLGRTGLGVFPDALAPGFYSGGVARST